MIKTAIITPEDKLVGKAVKRHRTERKVSQTKLAEALNLSTAQIQKYENGSSRVSATTLRRIAWILDVDMAEFFADLPPPGQELLEMAGRQDRLDSRISD